eukprot:11585593-Karenia_brevis.AAC.1
MDSGEPLLLWARSFRSRIWWDTILATASWTEWRREGPKQARPGRFRIWEDLLVEYMGHDWRHQAAC